MAKKEISHGQETFAFRPYYNPERRSEVFIVPGLIGVILTLTMTLFTSVAIVRERERGNLEFLIMTPLQTPELMMGKIIPSIVIGFLQISLLLFLGVLLFDAPIRGSFFDLCTGAAIFIAANLTLGLLISTLTQTQFQASQMNVFIFIPSILLSGFIFFGVAAAALIVAAEREPSLLIALLMVRRLDFARCHAEERSDEESQRGRNITRCFASAAFRLRMTAPQILMDEILAPLHRIGSRCHRLRLPRL